MGIAILVIAGVCLVLGILFGVALGWKWNLLRMLLTVALAGVLAIFTPGLTEKMTLAIAAAAGYKAPSMAALLTTILEPLGAIAKSSAIASVGAGLLKSAMIPLVYVILFLPVYLVSWIVYAIVHAIASKNAKEPTGLDRGIGALTGVVMGILVGALILSPFATLSGVMEMVKKSTSATASVGSVEDRGISPTLSADPRIALQREDADEFDLAGSLENLDLGGVELGKILTAYSDSPVSAVYKAVGAEKLMSIITEQISTIRENGKEYSFTSVLTELLSKADTISSAVRAVQNGEMADAISGAADLVQVVKGLPCFNGDDIADIVNTAIEVAAENGDSNVAAALSGVRFTDGDALSDDMDVIADILRKLADMGVLDGNGGFENIRKQDLDQVGSMLRSLKTLGTSVPLLVNSTLVSSSNGELEPICRTDLPEDQAGTAARDVVDVLLTVLDNFGGNKELTETQADQLENSLRALEDNPLIIKANLEKAIEYYVNQYSK